MIIHATLQQRTPEWKALRLGKLTASSAGDMLAKIKSGEAASRRNLRMRLVLERVTGQCQEDTFQSADMLRGQQLEPEAIRMYEASEGVFVTPCGFIEHTSLMAGYSPDGLVGKDGIVELKVPKSATHLEYLRTRELPSEYIGQVCHGLWLSGAQWCDFCSYDPRFPPDLQMLVLRIPRDEKAIKAYETMARMFLAEVDAEVAALGKLAGAA